MDTKLVASGGLLERQTPDGLRIALCRRTRYRDRKGQAGDWVLPKGKPDPGETSEATALREVEEETGCSGHLLGGQFVTEYGANDEPKTVTFYRMAFVAQTGEPDADEIAEVVWLSPAQAFDRLTYETERRVVGAAYGVRGSRGGRDANTVSG